MLSVRNVLTAIAVLGFGSLSMAAPSMNNEDSLGVRSDENTMPLEQRDVDNGLGGLVDRAAAVSCYITSKKGKNCHPSQCPAREQCEVNHNHNCVWKNKKKDRPFACDQCMCKKFS